MIVGALTLVWISLLSSVSSQEKYHICDGTTTEAAGLSGIVTVTGNCQLNLTGITGRISILRVSPCRWGQAQQFTIYRQPYCHNVESTDTYIDTTGGELPIAAEDVESFDMEYYHGKQSSCTCIMKKSVVRLNAWNSLSVQACSVDALM